jgi:hypothetical protein
MIDRDEDEMRREFRSVLASVPSAAAPLYGPPAVYQFSIAARDNMLAER